MADAFTGSNYYKRSFTEYEVEACKRDAAKQDKDIWRWSLTEHEVHSYDQQSETYSHIFAAAPGAPAAKIERRAELDAEIPALEAEIATAKPEHDHKLAAKIERRAELDAEIPALEAEIAAATEAKTKRSAELDAAKHAQGCNECSPAAKIERRAVLDAEIPALEAEIAAAKSKQADALAAKDAEITALMEEIAAAKSKRNNKLAAMDAEITALEAEIAANRS